MAEGDLITTEFQWEYRGLLLGPGTSYKTRFFDLALPEVRAGDVNRPREHGQTPGADFLGGRDFGVQVTITASDKVTLQDLVDALAAATAPGSDETPLVLRLGDGTMRRFGARPRRRSQQADALYAGRYVAELVLSFHATDPRMYDNNSVTAVLSLPTQVGGLAWPVAWPLAWGSATSGLAVVTNAGTFQAFPTITFAGPLTGPYVENLTTSQRWGVDTFDLLAGDVLVADFNARTVLLNGTASRYSYVTAASEWWPIAPGVNSLRLGASAGSGSATVVFRSAWV